MGINPPEPAVWAGVACWGSGFLRPPCEAASEESTEVLGSWKDCLCPNLQKQSVCARITCPVWPADALKNLFGVNSEKIWVNVGILGSWKDVDNL